VLSGNGRLAVSCHAIAALPVLLEPIFGDCKGFQFQTSDSVPMLVRVPEWKHIPWSACRSMFSEYGREIGRSLLDIHVTA
jgi:hypothetical protein